MWREVFGFNRAETFSLVALLLIFCVGGGIYLYHKTNQTLPAEMIFQPLNDSASPRREVLAAVADAPRVSRPLRLNLNTAPAESLVLLPDIGPVIGERIVAYRAAAGGFDSVGQLVEVRGIGAKRLAKLRPFLTLE